MLFETFGDFFTALWQTSFGVRQIWERAVQVFDGALEMSGIEIVRDALEEPLSPLAIATTLALLLLGVVIGAYGKRLMPIMQFVFAMFCGFFGGIFYATPLLENLVPLQPWVYGAIVATAAAILYRGVYKAAFAFVIGYPIYQFCYTGFTFLEPEEHSAVKAVFCFIVAVVIVAVCFVFKEKVEMAATSIIAGQAVYVTIKYRVFDFTSIEAFSGVMWLFPLLITLAVAAFGFRHQFKGRKRYK